jgi:hypothetical protein
MKTAVNEMKYEKFSLKNNLKTMASSETPNLTRRPPGPVKQMSRQEMLNESEQANLIQTLKSENIRADYLIIGGTV